MAEDSTGTDVAARHPRFAGDLDDLRHFTRLAESPVHSDARGQALAEWKEYNTVAALPPGARRPDGMVVKVAMWQAYRTSRRVDLRGVDFPHLILGTVDLAGAQLDGANLKEAKLKRSVLREASLDDADLTDALLLGADLRDASLRGAHLAGADLTGADLAGADLTAADLTGASLRDAGLVGVTIEGVRLDGARVYGASAWDVQGDPESSDALVITPQGEPEITVDRLKVAQFIYLLLSNDDVRDVIDTLTSKVVLILGRFTAPRKAVLDALRAELRRRDYSPILFDFDKPGSKSVTDTVKLLAQMARFVVVDLTDPASAPYEVAVIASLNQRSTPMVPLIGEGQQTFSMLDDLRSEPWLVDTHRYSDLDGLLASLDEAVIRPAERRVTELRGSTSPTFGA